MFSTKSNFVPLLFSREIEGGLRPKIFHDRFCASESLVSRFELDYSGASHRGCVNTVQWNAEGTLLVSGSDDTQVKIWDVAGRSLQTSIDTGHSANIFGARFLPFTNDKFVVSAAGDCEVRLSDLERKTTKKVFSHQGRAKKVAVDESTQNVIFTCSEDATVRQFDLRARANGSLSLCSSSLIVDLRQWKGSGSVFHDSVELNSIAIDPFYHSKICVGGDDAYVRLYDRRMLPDPNTAGALIARKEKHLVKAFAPQHMVKQPNRMRYGEHVTGVSFNHDGSKVAATYSGEAVYVFDINESLQSPSYPVKVFSGSSSKKRAKRANTTTSGCEVSTTTTFIGPLPLCSSTFTSTPAAAATATQTQPSPTAGKPNKTKFGEKLERIRKKHGLKKSSSSKTENFENSLKNENLVELCLHENNEKEKEEEMMDDNARVNQEETLVASTTSPAGSSDQPIEKRRRRSRAIKQIIRDEFGLPDSSESEESEPKRKEEKSEKDAVATLPISTDSEVENQNSDSDFDQNSMREDSDSFGEQDSANRNDDVEMLERSSSGSSESDGDNSEEEGGDGTQRLTRRGGSRPFWFEQQQQEEEFHMDSEETDSDLEMETVRPPPPPPTWTTSRTSDGEPSQIPDTHETYYRRYIGHRNVQTVKEVSFFGPRSEYVMSGSDDGRIFIWHTDTSKIACILKGDRDVVNCLAPHPTECTFASSGIDYDVKVWTPTAAKPFDPSMAHRIIEANEEVAGGPTRGLIPLSVLLNIMNARRGGEFAMPGSEDTEEEEERERENARREGGCSIM